MKLGVPVAEDAPIGRHEPVALTARGAIDAHNGSVKTGRSGGPVEPGAAKCENPTITSDQPVALSIGGSRHSHNGFVECDATYRSEVGSIAESIDMAIGGGLPVTL